ncbi:hypothetical protein ASE11_03950 [Hydrogenophaga sp. Root209]|uniref:hypothetical protein n=1 Tax=unclassified Hydrogenophaga TaxID=2610897 RepID=UPI0006FEB099|nr:hypothetical protein [Hydrogenophaga sp. Root209]KRC04220.1 hypothetical protein ASE11_03950 [Hydrogenophaga sp. Root209]
MSSNTDTDNAFPYTGIPSTEVVREPGHTGMAEHGTEITKHLLQEANDRVERMTDEADPLARHGGSDAHSSRQRRARQLRDAGRHAADSVRAHTRANPLTAVLAGVVVGVFLARITHR